MKKSNKKSELYRQNGFIVDEHGKVFNNFSRGIGFSVFYIKHVQQAPFFLVEIEDDFAEAATKEEAIKMLVKVLRDKE